MYAVCGDATGHGTASGMMVSIIKSGLNGLPALSTNKVFHRGGQEIRTDAYPVNAVLHNNRSTYKEMKE